MPITAHPINLFLQGKKSKTDIKEEQRIRISDNLH